MLLGLGLRHDAEEIGRAEECAELVPIDDACLDVADETQEELCVCEAHNRLAKST